MPSKQIGSVEFVALQATLMALVAFSIDAMLPALPGIAAQLSPANPNRAQLIVTSFVLGLGIGTFFAGPISDAYGRKPVIMAGFGLFMFGAALATFAQSLEMLLAARVLQGIGAAAPRLVPLALIRDLYSGRQMAQMLGLTTMIFMLMPAAAPAFGTLIIGGFGWRGVFASFIVFSIISVLWLALRQAETLPVENRRPLQPRVLWQGLCEVLSHRTVIFCTAVMTMGFGILFGTLSSTQQIFDLSFGRGQTFALWFGAIALLSLPAGFVNSRLVGRWGMRRMVTATFLSHLAVTLLVLLLIQGSFLSKDGAFAAYVIWAISVFWMANIAFGNLNAIALTPLGHLAGMASSIVIATSTVLAVGVAAPLGLLFDGTPVPLLSGVAVLLMLAIGLMLLMPKDPVPTPLA
jgi:MFS transporter, DHA1 family, multidrug resistance protein